MSLERTDKRGFTKDTCPASDVLAPAGARKTCCKPSGNTELLSALGRQPRTVGKTCMRVRGNVLPSQANREWGKTWACCSLLLKCH